MEEKDKLAENRCPVCLNASAVEFIAIEDVPIFCNVLWDTRKEALSAAKGQIRLYFCPDCAHVFNKDFDPSRIRYDSRYENTLQYSPVFRKYLIDLVDRLIHRHHLYKKDVIEIGCGRGDFLRLLSEKGGNRCTGFEPSYDEKRIDPNEPNTHIEVIRDYYTEKYSEYQADFIACRQVLEHIVHPRDFLATIRCSMVSKNSAVVFIEVPNVMFTLEKLGIWDLIYEHCGYYSAPSVSRLFNETGFHTLGVAESFGGQYLCIEARRSSGTFDSQLPEGIHSVEGVAALVGGFADIYKRTVWFWRDSLQKMKQQGIRAVVWGAGSKGITFLNVLRTNDLIDYVVDINPYKQGRHVPGTGQQVVSPDALADIKPQVVIAMNPLYTDEIKQIIAKSHLEEDARPIIMPVDKIENHR